MYFFLLLPTLSKYNLFTGNIIQNNNQDVGSKFDNNIVQIIFGLMYVEVCAVIGAVIGCGIVELFLML